MTALPMLVLCVGMEAYGLQKYGDRHGEFGRTTAVSPERLQHYVAVELAAGLILFFGGAKLTQVVSTGFNFFPTYTDCFRLVVYVYSPHYWFRMVDGLPAVNTWICWGAGALCAMYLLYHGVALALRPDITKGFGLYILMTLVLVMLSGITHLLAVATLLGKLAI
ncbi:MAG TPA: hypothetical protein VHH73_16410 [Verrucomicrobiae bacterium]|nr:hypothetical protein [Verrucomicrobiae bacterium]